MDGKDIIVILILVCVILEIFAFFVWIQNYSDSNELGKMICSEKGNYVFNYYDRDNQTVICEKNIIQKYDGGYIKIKRR